MNVTQMTALRPDGHPSTYYLGATAGPAPLNKQDCRHWCLPGIPDTWNELLYARILTRVPALTKKFNQICMTLEGEKQHILD